MGKGPKPEWLDGNIDSAYEPLQKDLPELKTKTKKWSKIFLENYQPIRHKIFAHKEINQITNGEEFFRKTNIGQIEQMLTFLHSIESFVFQLLHNGKKRELTDFEHDTEQRIYGDLETLIEYLKKGAFA